jgi:hypothetical protein
VLVALVPAAFLSVFAALRRNGTEVREAILAALTFVGAYTALITELLGVLHWLGRWPLAFAWAGLGVAAALFPRSPAAGASSNRRPGITKAERWLRRGAALLVAVVAVDSALAAPNTWDSMMYHLPRVVRWLDERSVSFYPTIDYQQVTMPPWNEYAMLQAHALWGGDRFDSMVSFVSWLGSAIAVSSIAATLGAGPRGQSLAALACLTLPQGVLMASSSKNEWALAFWLAVATLAVLRWAKEPRSFYALLGGTALGLAVFTKGTAYIYFPWIFIAAAVQWDRTAWRRFLYWAPVVGALALAPSLPLLARNQQLTGHALGFDSPIGEADPVGRTNFAVRHITLRGTAAGIIRNVSLHLGTPSVRVNEWIYRAVVGSIHAIGADPDDPDAMMEGKSSRHIFPFGINKLMRHEIYAGSPWHAWLFVVSIIALARRPRHKSALLLGAALFAGFIALSGYLRYQPFNARLQLALLTIGSAMIGLFLEQRTSKAGNACAALLLLLAFPYALSNNLRPFVSGRSHPGEYYPQESILLRPRDVTYFADAHPWLATSWIAAAHAVDATGCRDVGIDSTNLYTYPMFALLGAGIERHVRYLGVTNRTRAYAHESTPGPCAVVCLYCADPDAPHEDYDAIGTALRFDNVVAWLPRKTAASAQ